MLKVVKSWIDRYFSDEEAVILFLIIGLGLAFIVFWGDILAPVIASVILAYVLQGLVAYLRSKGVPKVAAVYVSYLFFLGIVLGFFFSILPLVWRQLTALIRDMPTIVTKLKKLVFSLQEEYSTIITLQELDIIIQDLTSEVANLGQWVLSQSIEGLPVFITAMIYLIVVPILVFFFIKDKDRILQSLVSFLPKKRRLMNQVWDEMNRQFANYVRGKVVEITVVGGCTYIGFIFMSLNYSALLAILVGLSVVIPYIGAVLVTIPVTMIALFQFGLSDAFYYVMFIFLIIQLIDGNVLVPLLFSEVVNLHPTIIIISVLFFGGIWGVWGVFFAIPLATMIKAVFNAWPRDNQTQKLLS
ncbi:MAG: AI-2E family transporter [Oleiphilus sp.]